MRTLLTIKGGHLEVNLDGLKTNYPLSSVVVNWERGLIRADVLVEYAKHAFNQEVGTCPPDSCEICKTEVDSHQA